MVHSIWYVEATCSGCKMREGNMFWSTPSNIIQHKILSVVWRCTEFPGIYAVLGLGKPRGLCVFIVHHSTLYSNHSKLYISRYIYIITHILHQVGERHTFGTFITDPDMSGWYSWYIGCCFNSGFGGSPVHRGVPRITKKGIGFGYSGFGEVTVTRNRTREDEIRAGAMGWRESSFEVF